MATIEVRGRSKWFGNVPAVHHVTAEVRPGQVRALLGPNGAGKTTTLRTLLGLVAPTTGTATVGGKRYHELPEPLRQVGAVLEASGCHPGRTALDHLRILATAARLSKSAPMRVLGETGLADDAGRRVVEFSLGMRQRLGLAAAVLGDPACSCWTSRPTVSIRKGDGCACTSAGSQTRAVPSSSPATR